MDAVDTYMTLCAASLFLGLVLDDAGMEGVAVVFWGICIVCVVLACYSAGTKGRKRRKKKRRR